MVALHVVVLSIWVISGMIINGFGAPITCDAGTYSEGQKASITCNFRTDVSASQRSFNMARFSSAAQRGEIGTDVLVCHWAQDSQQHDCSVTPGYTFDGSITNHVKVDIPKADDTYAGLYMCFFVPAQGRDSHGCDFLTKDDPSNVPWNDPSNDTTTHVPTPTDNPKALVIAAISVVLIALVGCVVACYCCRLRRNKRHEQGEPGETVSLIKPKNEQIKKRLENFELSTKNLKKMMSILDREMSKGLTESMRSEADIKMYPAFCPKPDGSDLGEFLMVDFGSTSVKVSGVKFRTKGVLISSDSYPLDPGMKNATCEQIFDYIVSVSVTDKNKSAEQLKIVLVFHFPCHHKNLDKANIAKWTKEFCCEGVVDQDLNELLQKSIQRRTDKLDLKDKQDLKLKVVAIVNSAVNTLISAVFNNPKCMICLVVGNGFNACYVDKYQQEDTDGAEGKGSYEIYNTELGALGENGSLDYLRTDHDKELDKSSKKPGSQILEKMTSWTYIGEIVRLALEDLRKAGLVLSDAPDIGGVSRKANFTADHVATIYKDMSDNSGETAAILRTLGIVNPTEEDLKTVKYTCSLVTERAASLAAASLATLINRLDQPEIVIVVDGELYREIPRFHDVMYSKTQELVKPELRDKFHLVSSLSKCCLGAVRMAAAELSKQN